MQDFGDRVRQLHRLVDLGFPEFSRYVRSLDSELASAILHDYPTAEAFLPRLVPVRKAPGSARWARPHGNARFRAALWMPTLTAVRRNRWLRAYYEGLLRRGKLPKVALFAAMRKLLIAVYFVAKNRKPFVSILAEARA